MQAFVDDADECFVSHRWKGDDASPDDGDYAQMPPPVPDLHSCHHDDACGFGAVQGDDANAVRRDGRLEDYDAWASLDRQPAYARVPPVRDVCSRHHDDTCGFDTRHRMPARRRVNISRAYVDAGRDDLDRYLRSIISKRRHGR